VRITVDIDAGLLEELMALVEVSEESVAIANAVIEYVKRRKAQEFGRLLREGHFDYPLSNEEIEEQDI